MGEPTSKPRVDDAVVPRRVFLAIGGLVAGLAVLYWFTAYEDAGTVMLALAAVLASWYGVFLWLRLRRTGTDVEAGSAVSAAPATTAYLPHASVWPFAMGLGVTLLLDGVVLGIWVMVPGAGLLVLGIAGFLRQSRRRD